MRKRINNYFIGGLLKNAGPFEVAKIKLTYNFGLWYFAIVSSLESQILNTTGFFAILFPALFFAFSILFGYFLHKKKLKYAIITFFTWHIFLGPLMLLQNTDSISSVDAMMGIILLTLGMLLLDNVLSIAWVIFVLGEFTAIILIQLGYLDLDFIIRHIPKFEHDPHPAEVLMPFLLCIYLIYTYVRAKGDAEKLIQRQQQDLLLKSTEITDSINYAKSLQSYLQPGFSEAYRYFNHVFVFSMPRDIVSGDFYWFHRLSHEETIYAVADCTGHGVPGAMVSVICTQALNKTVKEEGVTDPGRILDRCREIIIEHLGEGAIALKNGMDISLVSVNHVNYKIKWAAAFQKIYVASKNEIMVLSGDKQPVSYSPGMVEFTTNHLQLDAQSHLYLTTDGFADQFGGPASKKLKTKKLREELQKIQSQKFEFEHALLKEFFLSWKGTHEQTDDVCLMGIRVG